jgi:hypothetical protein
MVNLWCVNCDAEATFVATHDDKGTISPFCAQCMWAFLAGQRSPASLVYTIEEITSGTTVDWHRLCLEEFLVL